MRGHMAMSDVGDGLNVLGGWGCLAGAIVGGRWWVPLAGGGV